MRRLLALPLAAVALALAVAPAQAARPYMPYPHYCFYGEVIFCIP